MLSVCGVRAWLTCVHTRRLGENAERKTCVCEHVIIDNMHASPGGEKLYSVAFTHNIDTVWSVSQHLNTITITNHHVCSLYTGLVPKSAREMAPPREVRKSAPWAVTLLAAAPSHGLQRFRPTDGPVAVAAAALRTAR